MATRPYAHTDYTSFSSRGGRSRSLLLGKEMELLSASPLRKEAQRAGLARPCRVGCF